MELHTHTIKCQMRKRERLCKKASAKRERDDKAWKAYYWQRNHVQKLLHKAHEDYISGVIGQSLSDGNQKKKKKIFSYLKLKRAENINITVPSTNGIYHVIDYSKLRLWVHNFCQFSLMRKLRDFLKLVTFTVSISWRHLVHSE